MSKLKKIGTLSGGNLPDWVGDCPIYQGKYPYDGAIAIILGDPEEPYAVFSKNLRSYGAKITDEEFHVDENNMGEKLLKAMLATGLFEDTGRADDSGFCTYPVWRLK